MANSVQKLDTATISAVIVLYYPEKIKLLKLLESIKQTVNFVILIDNTDSTNELNSNFFKTHYPETTYLGLGDNLGIGVAQNKGIRLAANSECSHVIFFDQDSNPQSDMILKLLLEEERLLAEHQNVGAIGPTYIDEKTATASKPIQFFAGNLIHRIRNKAHESSIQADFIISSGSLIRLSVLEEVGMMREDLFIDGVDVEWAIRAANKGFKHFVIAKAIMTHSIGDSSLQLGSIRIDLHKEVRNFYKIRNLCFLMFKKPYSWRFMISMCYKIPAYILVFTLVSQSKLSSLILYCSACCDGFSGTLGKIKD